MHPFSALLILSSLFSVSGSAVALTMVAAVAGCETKRLTKLDTMILLFSLLSSSSCVHRNVLR